MQYEYMVINSVYNMHSVYLPKIQEAGEKGWSLCATIQRNNYIGLVFMRQLDKEALTGHTTSTGKVSGLSLDERDLAGCMDELCGSVLRFLDANNFGGQDIYDEVSDFRSWLEWFLVKEKEKLQGLHEAVRHQRFEDWAYEVSNADTCLGFFDWLKENPKEDD